VYKLIIAGSIEEKIIEMQERKAALSNSVLSEDNEQTVKFSEDDLVGLLAPIG
jgi:SNF2 family DNA or RNA helicase